MKLITDHPLNYAYPYALRVANVVEDFFNWHQTVENNLSGVLNSHDYLISPITGTIYFKTRDAAMLARMAWGRGND
jgi:hypothetical protein